MSGGSSAQYYVSQKPSRTLRKPPGATALPLLQSHTGEQTPVRSIVPLACPRHILRRESRATIRAARNEPEG